MLSRKLARLFALIVVGAGFAMAPACAAGLLGSSLEWQYYGGGGAYDPGNGSVTNGTFTVDGGTGGTFIDQGPLSVFNILADDTSITFDYSPDMTVGPWTPSPESLAPTIDNGIAINLLSGGSFADVSLDSATNMTGFGDSNFSFSNNQIQVDWGNLPFTSSTVVKLDVTLAGASAPEPATGFLTLILFLTLAPVLRRKTVS